MSLQCQMMLFYKSLGTWYLVEKLGHILPTSRRQNANDDHLHHQEDEVLVLEAEMIDGGTRVVVVDPWTISLCFLRFTVAR